MDEAYRYDRQASIPASLEDNENAVEWAKRLDDCRSQIDQLFAGAGKIWRPALLQQADERWGRAARVFRAGFAPDIETDLAGLEKMLGQIVAELNDERTILSLPATFSQNSQMVPPETIDKTTSNNDTIKSNIVPKAPFSVTVNPGNSLWRLSRRYQGSGNLYPKIFEANRNIIDHPDLIYPGQVIAIPELSK